MEFVERNAACGIADCVNWEFFVWNEELDLAGTVEDGHDSGEEMWTLKMISEL